jgi:hypothetical protein
MYQFAIVALLALATLKVVDFVSENVPAVERFRSLLTLVIAVGATVWLDFSLFDRWGVDVRDDTLGLWITGFLVAGLTVAWQALFGWLGHVSVDADATTAGTGVLEERKAAQTAA